MSKSDIPPRLQVLSLVKGSGLHRTYTLGDWNLGIVLEFYLLLETHCWCPWVHPPPSGEIKTPLSRQGQSRVCLLAACTLKFFSPVLPREGPICHPLSQFWPWVSISDERLHGKEVTFTPEVDLVISFGKYFLISSASPLSHCC